MTAAEGPLARLAALGLTLPAPPAAVAAYLPTVSVPIGDDRVMVFVAGQVALKDGAPVDRGRVPDEVSVERAVENARLCALNVLAQLEREVGLDSVEKVAQLTVFVRSADDFGGQPQVANAASELIADVLGDAGHHARAAVGSNALPFGVAVEITAVAVARQR